jgi:hypothetical protein
MTVSVLESATVLESVFRGPAKESGLETESAYPLEVESAWPGLGSGTETESPAYPSRR